MRFLLRNTKPLLFSGVYGLLLVAVTLAGIELLAGFYAPPWPARALRTASPTNPVTAATVPFSGQPWISDPFNSWGMRDRERTIAKPVNGPRRVIFVGDSFVESAFTPLSLPAAVEQRAAASGNAIEAVNLGVASTDPKSYYYRMRDVALKLSPDALALFFYAGNDFMAPGDGYPPWPSLVDESPGNSLLGSVMPRTSWLLVNRLKLSSALHGPPPPPGESEMLYDDLRAPSADRLDRLVAHVRKFYRPEVSEQTIRDILSRGDGRLSRPMEARPGDQDYLMGWLLNTLVISESASWDVARDRKDAERLAGGGEVEAALSWIEAADRLARQHGVPLIIFLAPTAGVDPDYADFWKPWARYYAWNYLCEAWLDRLTVALRKTDVRFIDLREDLTGIPGTYRKLDGHWSERGESIVADRVRRELSQPK